jgi:hypothetical protein
MSSVIRIRVCLCVLTIGVSSMAFAQTEKGSSKEIKKGDTISVKGCLSGTALAATDLASADSTGALASGVTFRLTGDKSLLKQMREKADGKIVDVEGVLKSDLTQDGVQTRKVGKMRITIGSPAAVPGRPAAETQRSLPVLEVKSFDGSATTCGH